MNALSWNKCLPHKDLVRLSLWRYSNVRCPVQALSAILTFSSSRGFKVGHGKHKVGGFQGLKVTLSQGCCGLQLQKWENRLVSDFALTKNLSFLCRMKAASDLQTSTPALFSAPEPARCQLGWQNRSLPHLETTRPPCRAPCRSPQLQPPPGFTAGNAKHLDVSSQRDYPVLGATKPDQKAQSCMCCKHMRCHRWMREKPEVWILNSSCPAPLAPEKARDTPQANHTPTCLVGIFILISDYWGARRFMVLCFVTTTLADSTAPDSQDCPPAKAGTAPGKNLGCSAFTASPLQSHLLRHQDTNT